MTAGTSTGDLTDEANGRGPHPFSFGTAAAALYCNFHDAIPLQFY